MRNILFTFFMLIFILPLTAQEYVHNTFKDRWVINTFSVDMLPKRKLDIRITHRFGDLAGDAGGFQTFFGLENAEDVLIGFEYGLLDNFSMGLFRAKGAGDLPQLLNGTFKYRILRQQENGMPISLTAVGVFTLSTAKKQEGAEGLVSFPKFTHRMVTNLQVLAAHKYSDRFSMQLSAGYTHRNLTLHNEENDLYNLGLATRLQFSKVIGLIVDFTLPVNGPQSPFSDSDASEAYSPALGIGLEIDTGGHIFQLNLTNSQGIMPTDYIPYTRNAKWSDGQFRLGFTISRMFNL